MAAFLLLLLLLLQSPPFIVAVTPSSDDTATPATEVSPTVATVLIVFVAVFFFSGLIFVAIRKIIDNGWCGSSSGGDSLVGGGTRPRRPSDGLTKEAVQALPIYFYKDVKMHRQVGKGEIECAVCLNEFQDTEVLRLLPKCSHVFHPDCVEPWLLSQATCPVCRTIVQNSQCESGESEASDDHVITIDHYLPDVNHDRPSDPDLTTGSTLTKSHSTGHSPVWTGDLDQRFTLRLPDEAATITWQFRRARSQRRGYRSNILCWGRTRLNRDYKPDRSESNHNPSVPNQDFPLSNTGDS